MGLEEDRHDEAIAGLYEAALAPERWHAALMQATQQVGADTFHFLTWDRHDATTAFNLYSHEWMAANPGGQVPYASNSGLITDRLWMSDGAVTPIVPEEPLAAFVVPDAPEALAKLTGIAFTTSPAVSIEEFDKLMG